MWVGRWLVVVMMMVVLVVLPESDGAMVWKSSAESQTGVSSARASA